MDEKEAEKIDTNGEQLGNLEIDSNPARDFWEFFIDLFKTGVIVFIIAFTLRYFVVQPYIVDGESMMPNYQNREYLLAEKVSYYKGSPKRGDVVIFKYPKNPSVNYIKRIIGLPGEKVEIEDNTVIIFNSKHATGTVLSEEYIPKSTLTQTPNNSLLSMTLKDNEYFVLGDNREHSSDSREWGVLPFANILGRSWLTLTPFSLAGFHSRITYPNLSKSISSPLAIMETKL
ncbi:signal peptidase I [Candidatus Berkelbacteria bacterium CG10_big_fil_rev_8_21_14_0_10_43_13]|uniref:Signal peptidase I n=1 Tax=Candidatus Berkelbacteria bacterium CG10_big_fil_rev_8_21_14_0_10_43_13 TaxID=1974514 RepID=A0A2H0W7G8_9BACT|nr:MAG: signal peptidase I [Candidatus Berkelbacteria bacterium CG10_big_fil_rev_8_21_14_0_10_43_13]